MSRSVRPNYMRGGLGRTLLTAFLVLTIVPLSVISFYSLTRMRAETANAARIALEHQASLISARLMNDAIMLERDALLWMQGAPFSPALNEESFWLLDAQQHVMRSTTAEPIPDTLFAQQRRQVIRADDAGRVFVWRLVPLGEQTLVARARPSLLSGTEVVEEGIAIWLIADDEVIPLVKDGAATIEVDDAGLLADESPDWLAVRQALDDGVMLVVAQPRDIALAASNAMAGALIAAALAVALLTTVAAAYVIRRITRPVFDLTMAAIAIAQGDLDKRARVDRDDELGVLALAFNTMADRLQELLNTLEQRVAERTAEVARANRLLERRAGYLEASARIIREVGRLESPAVVLQAALPQICERMNFAGAAVWLLDASRNGDRPHLTLRHHHGDISPQHVEPVLSEVVAAAHGRILPAEEGTFLVLPLRMGEQVTGVLALVMPDEAQPGDLQTLQVLADQLAVALENARAIEYERLARKKLQMLQKHRDQFLGKMSHELSTALNSIIGFSTLMLREIEGPLTEMQRSDLTYINRNGQHLLDLLDGMLELIEAESNEEIALEQVVEAEME